ncbi:MAG: Phytochrome-like protein cph2, partial [Pseudomonadota bacterium]
MDMSADAAALDALATPAPAGPTPTTTGDGPDGADGAVALVDLTVMMIDDEPMLTEVIGTYLEDAGYRRVVGINDATVALEQVRALNPALVLLDLVMPGVSGFEILQAMRQDEQLRYTPVIVLTAASDPDTKLKALSIGATEF